MLASSPFPPRQDITMLASSPFPPRQDITMLATSPLPPRPELPIHPLNTVKAWVYTPANMPERELTTGLHMVWSRLLLAP